MSDFDSEPSDIEYESEQSEVDTSDLSDIFSESEEETKPLSGLALSEEEDSESESSSESETDENTLEKRIKKSNKKFESLDRIMALNINDFYDYLNTISADGANKELLLDFENAFRKSVDKAYLIKIPRPAETSVNTVSSFLPILQTYILFTDGFVDIIKRANTTLQYIDNVKDYQAQKNYLLEDFEKTKERIIKELKIYVKRGWIENDFFDKLYEIVSSLQNADSLLFLNKHLHRYISKIKEDGSKKILKNKLLQAKTKHHKKRKKFLTETLKQLQSTDEFIETDPRILNLKVYKETGEVSNEIREEILNLWNTFALNRKRYRTLNNYYKKDAYLTGVKLNTQEASFFEQLPDYYDNPKQIVDKVYYYLEQNLRQAVHQELNKNINIRDINNIINDLNVDFINKDLLSADEKELLSTLEISWKRTANENTNQSEFAILNNYVRAMRYALIRNELSIQQMVTLGQIDNTFENYIKNLINENQLQTIKNVLQFIVKKNDHQFKLLNLLSSLKQSASSHTDSVLTILIINNYFKAITKLAMQNTNQAVEDISYMVSDGKIDEKFGGYLIDMLRGNIPKKNASELFEYVLSQFSLKKQTRFIRDPLQPSLVRRRLRIINDADVTTEKTKKLGLPKPLLECMSIHKLREWIDIPKDYIYFIGNKGYNSVENMKNLGSAFTKEIKYYGDFLAYIKPIREGHEQVRSLPIYEPSNEFWKMHCTVNHMSNDKIKCKYQEHIYQLTDAKLGGIPNTREFFYGLYNPKTQHHILFNDKDFEKECKYFEDLGKTDEAKLRDFYNYEILNNPTDKIRQNVVERLEKIFIANEDLTISRSEIRKNAEELEKTIFNSLPASSRVLYRYIEKVANILILFDSTKVLYDLTDYVRHLYYITSPSEYSYLIDLDWQHKIPILSFINTADKEKIIKLVNDIVEVYMEDLVKYIYLMKNNRVQLNIKPKNSGLQSDLLKEILTGNKVKNLKESLIDVCQKSSDPNRVFLVGKSDKLYCVNPSNYYEYLNTDDIKDDDKEFIDEIFSSSSRLSKERKLIYMYLAQQYLLTKNNAERLENTIKDAMAQELELFGSETGLLETDFELLNDVFKHIEDSYKVKLTDKEKVEIFNYVKSTLLDYSDISDDILALLADRRDEYIQQYVREYKSRLDKYKYEYPVSSNMYKALVQNDIEGRLKIFNDIIQTLAEKYRNKYVEFEFLDLNSPFITYLIQYISEILDYMVKVDNENWSVPEKSVERKCYKCGKVTEPYARTFLHEKSDYIDDVKEQLILLNPEVYVCSEKCLAELQDTLREEKTLKEHLIKSLIATITARPKDDKVLKISQVLRIPNYENMSISDLWNIVLLSVNWRPDFGNVKTVHGLKELSKLFRIQFNIDKLQEVWYKLLDNKRFYEYFMSSIDTERYSETLQDIRKIHKSQIKVNDDYLSVACNILEKDAEPFIRAHAENLYRMFLSNTPIEQSNIINIFNDFQLKFKCKVSEDSFNKYTQYTKTVKLLNLLITAVDQLLKEKRQANFSNIKDKMKSILKERKVEKVYVDINYLISSLNNITKRSYTLDDLTKFIITKLVLLQSKDQKTKYNIILREILPSDKIQLDFDELLNVKDTYNKVAFRVISQLRSLFNYGADFETRLWIEQETDNISKKQSRPVIRKGMTAEQKEAIRQQQKLEVMQTQGKSKIKLLQKSKEQKEEKVETDQVAEQIRSFESFVSRVTTFMYDYIKDKLRLEVDRTEESRLKAKFKAEQIKKEKERRKKAVDRVDDLEEGELLDDSDTEEIEKGILMSEIDQEIGDLNSGAFVKEQPQLIFAATDSIEDADENAEPELDEPISIVEPISIEKELDDLDLTELEKALEKEVDKPEEKTQDIKSSEPEEEEEFLI